MVIDAAELVKKERNMLYNESTGQPKAIHSLDSLISWLEKKNPEEIYDYTDIHHCLIGQYYTDMGLKDVSVSSTTFRTDRLLREPLPAGFNEISLGKRTTFINTKLPYNRTFGAALERAKYFREHNAA